MVKFENQIKSKKILVVCFDAGGADVVSSWIFVSKLKNFDSYLRGPACKIFDTRIKKINQKKKINLEKYDLIITGSSLRSWHEINIIKEAKKLNIPTITFLDHWVNYKKRFLRNKKYYFPNSFVVMDKCAQRIAKLTFKNKEIHLFENYRKKYFNIFFKKKKKLRKKNEYLYFSSNYASVKTKKIDHKILFKFENYLIKSGIKNYKIYIRNHPSEDIKKYQSTIDNKKFFKDNSKNIYDCVSNYANFFGSESMGLIFAKYGKRKVFNLRFKNIEKIPTEILNK